MYVGLGAHGLILAVIVLFVMMRGRRADGGPRSDTDGHAVWRSSPERSAAYPREREAKEGGYPRSLSCASEAKFDPEVPFRRKGAFDGGGAF
jgi:hypothetical protein